MHYELYIDVFFLVNFMMDYILLMLVRSILKCQTTRLHILFGAVLGAILTCAVVVLPIPYAFVKFILFHCFVNVVMIKTGLHIKWDQTFPKAIAVLYISGVILGGILSFLRQYVRMGSLFFALAVAGYYGALGIWNLLAYFARVRNCRCEVVLCHEEKHCRIAAMLDTGNTLRDSLSGKPVSIVPECVVKELYGERIPEGIRYIPYHSVGKSAGVLPVFPLDKMCVCQDGEKWIAHPVIGICDGDTASDGTYQMILNPDIL